jgi:SH3-like domain-containing protein
MIETLLAVMLAFGTPAGLDQPNQVNQVLPAATSSLPAGYYKQAQRNLRVYTHPRRNSYAFGQLYRGEIVLVDRCRRRWCLINHYDDWGWIVLVDRCRRRWCLINHYDDWGWVKRKHLVSVRNQRNQRNQRDQRGPGSIDLEGLRFWFDFKL